MGTAPGQQHDPAMPDPARLVTASLTILRRHGFDERHALLVIGEIAARIGNTALLDYGADATWLTAIQLITRRRLAALHPSTPITQGDEHGDGSSSRPGGAAQQ